jgi:hypothetical protein
MLGSAAFSTRNSRSSTDVTSVSGARRCRKTPFMQTTSPAIDLQPCRIHPAASHRHVARCSVCLGPLDHGPRAGCYSSVIEPESREVRWLCAER